MQEEILWLCEAAHVPVIWATQVLETLAKTGMPSRAEVTDAAGIQFRLLNTSRGPVVDEAALAHSLKRGEIAGAGIEFQIDGHARPRARARTRSAMRAAAALRSPSMSAMSTS